MNFILVAIYFRLADDANFSVQSPVLVNRGWVPRSWRDKAFQFSQDLEETKTVATSASLTGEKRSFWRFWSKEPQTNEVGLLTVSVVYIAPSKFVEVLRVEHGFPIP